MAARAAPLAAASCSLWDAVVVPVSAEVAPGTLWDDVVAPGVAEVLWGPWVDVAEAAGATPAADADVGTSKILSGSPASGSSLKKVTGGKLSLGGSQ